MIEEYKNYILDAGIFSGEYGEQFRGIRFDEKDQAVEVFVLQSLAMCSSHCRAAASLLEQNYLGESIIVLRSIQELFFNINWILTGENDQEKLERVYRLEADPYAHWEKETKLISSQLSKEIGENFRGPLDEIASHNKHLTEMSSNGTVRFKRAPSLSDRMGDKLRPIFYHIYKYSSLFAHPTPFIKSLYLRMSGDSGYKDTKHDESAIQFISYTLLFVEFIMTQAEQCLGKYITSTKNERDLILSNMKEIVIKGNKGYFPYPL